MAAVTPNTSAPCEQCGQVTNLPVPLGPEDGPLHLYCLDCLADRVEYVTGWRVRKAFRQWNLARKYAQMQAAELAAMDC